MRRSIVSLFSFLAIALIALTGCQEPQNTIPGSVDSISVRVMDSTDAKTITPDGNVNISHYVITVVNEAEGINQSSGYLTKGSMFTVSNVPAGTWYAKVDAYIDRGEDTYVKVASDQSEPKTVQAGASTTFELVLDTLDAVASGDVTVTLKMPAALSAESTAFWYQYTITGMTDEEFSLTSALLSGTTGADGLATITLDAATLGLMQGAYRFEITVQDKQNSPTLTRKGVDVMRLVNGLEAKGTIDLTAYEADQSFEVTITDKIGDILTPTLQNGQEVYNLDGQDGSASLTVTLAEPLKANETIEWYVDGELDVAVNADEAVSEKYTLTFTPGSHIVTAIVRDTDTLMAVGSIEAFKVRFVVAEIAAQMFTFSPSNNGKSYTVTGLANPIGEFEMPSSGVLEIPATYQGKPVTKIAQKAFEDRTDIVGSVVIPDGVTEIEIHAFQGCSELESISISEGLRKISSGAFYGCSALVEVNLPSTLIEILGSNFYGGAFQNCSSLSRIVIPEGVTFIGESAFRGCSSLTEITIPEGVTSIRESTFYGCSSLTSINIPDGVTSIGGEAFSGCSALTNITIPDSVTSIGQYAFRDCSALTSINIPEGVTSIGGYAFRGCSALTSINIPEGVTSIETETFSGCSGLTNITIPDGVISIGTQAFRGCSALTNITIPDGVKSIGISAFYGCSALTNITIPEGVTQIGDFAFKNCSNLTDITIPEGVTRVGDSAFDNCSGLTSITIPESVTSIGHQAFFSCSSLTSIIIPGNVTSIGNQAFLGCSSLTSIAIPEGVTSIGYTAFTNCSSLTDIYCEAASRPEGWHTDWLGVCHAEVHWGYTGE